MNMVKKFDGHVFVTVNDAVNDSAERLAIRRQNEKLLNYYLD